LGGVRRRAGADFVSETVGWKRRVGGKFGLNVDLPAGCISDDTQLRLATSRSMRARGAFDVETFAKIELTVWPSYALGAGRGSLEAAANLRRRDTTWATNFFSADRAEYLNGGGNGAAMRIQPHVWGRRRDATAAALTADVVKNAAATHGHLRGILGAVFHAQCLLHVLEERQVPGLDVCRGIAHGLREVGAIVESDPTLSELWLGQWELHSGARLADQVDVVAREVEDDLQSFRGITKKQGPAGYFDGVERLEAFRPEQRGSGTKTAILASLAAWLFADDPLAAVATCANCLGTDTDTIATMAGALVGAIAVDEPSGKIADRDYIALEADRMWAMSEGLDVAGFQYPDLVRWSPPKSASDCVGLAKRTMEVAGLGPAEPITKEYATTGKTPGVWQWSTLWFGQTILPKRRPHPKPLSSSQRVVPEHQYLAISRNGAGQSQAPDPVALTLSFDVEEAPLDARSTSLHDLTNRVIASDFDPAVIGAGLLELAERPDGIEASLAYVSIITKARMSRRDRGRPSP
jgi:ADP-ribosylglycohydrolase